MRSYILKLIFLVTLLVGQQITADIQVQRYEPVDSKGSIHTFRITTSTGIDKSLSYYPQDKNGLIALTIIKQGVPTYLSSFIKKSINNQKINQFAQLKRVLYEQADDLSSNSDLGKLFFAENNSFLNINNRMICKPGYAVLANANAANLKCYLILQFTRINGYGNLFKNPQAISPYSKESTFASNDTHVYTLIDVSSQNFENIVEHFNVSENFDNDNLLKINLTPKNQDLNIKFQIVDNDVSVLTDTDDDLQPETNTTETNTTPIDGQPQPESNTPETNTTTIDDKPQPETNTIPIDGHPQSETNTSTTGTEKKPESLDYRIIISIVASIVVVVGITVAIVIVASKKRHARHQLNRNNLKLSQQNVYALCDSE